MSCNKKGAGKAGKAKPMTPVKKTKTGKAMLESIEKSGKTVTIKPTTGGNSENADTGDGFVGTDGKPGKGSNSTVLFNPDREKIGTEPSDTRPPAIGLAHELIHAEQDANGTTKKGNSDNDKVKDPSDPTKFQQVPTYEVETAGIPPNDKGSFTENKIRSEWDPKQPERKWY